MNGKLKDPRTVFVRRPITVRLSMEELDKVDKSARTWTNGRISEWVRYAALHFKPRKHDLK